MDQAWESHAGFKAQWAHQQKDKINLVAEWRGMGSGKDGKRKKPKDKAKGRTAVTALEKARRRAPKKTSAKGKASIASNTAMVNSKSFGTMSKLKNLVSYRNLFNPRPALPVIATSKRA
ncbi:MAG: hypothetical protein FRX49_13534 [Trebouxia sp. A1-2]|nr:MAG: hypothetical protein FRX49_13534 [Trebouxia sp. A1-2]